MPFNNSQPNNFSVKMLQNLADISGEYPILRIGGATQNFAVWDPNQTVALTETFAYTGADQPIALTIGPAWLQSFQVFPEGVRYIYGLSFMNGTSGFEQTLLEANASFKALRDSIYAYEIGNEVDGNELYSQMLNSSWGHVNFVLFRIPWGIQTQELDRSGICQSVAAIRRCYQRRCV